MALRESHKSGHTSIAWDGVTVKKMAEKQTIKAAQGPRQLIRLSVMRISCSSVLAMPDKNNGSRPLLSLRNCNYVECPRKHVGQAVCANVWPRTVAAGDLSWEMSMSTACALPLFWAGRWAR